MFCKLAVLRCAHADSEKIRVERRCAHQREYFSGRRVERDDSATPALQRVEGDLLQVEIQAQIDIGAGVRRLIQRQRIEQLARIRRHLPAAGIGDEVPKSGITMQAVLETALDSRLSGVRCAGVARGVEPLHIAGIQGADVADGMSEQLTMRIVAHQSRLKIDAGKARSLDCEVGDFLVAQSKLQRNRLELLAASTQLLEARNVVCAIRLNAARRFSVSSMSSTCSGISSS